LIGEVGADVDVRVVDGDYRAIAAQAAIEEEQIFGAEVVGGARVAGEPLRILGVEGVLPIVAATRLVVGDDEAADFFGVALAGVGVDGVEDGAGKLTTHNAFPISAARS